MVRGNDSNYFQRSFVVASPCAYQEIKISAGMCFAVIRENNFCDRRLPGLIIKGAGNV